MKKQNLTFGQKVATAAFAVALASSSLAFVPTVALAAEAQSYTDAVAQKLYSNKIDTVVFRAEYDSSDSSVLKGYDLLLVKDGELVDEVEAYNLNESTESDGYTVDLASKGYELASGATIKYAIVGNNRFGWGLAGSEYYYRYKGEIPTDDVTFATMNIKNYTTYAIDGLEFSESGALLRVKRYNSGAVQTVIDAIDAIGEIEYTAECKQRARDAYNAYNALGEEDQKLVTNYDTLRSAWQATKYVVVKVGNVLTNK
jgi:hypothetical protein